MFLLLGIFFSSENSIIKEIYLYPSFPQKGNFHTKREKRPDQSLETYEFMKLFFNS